MRDPYQILGVDKGAPQSELKRVYRKLAKELHPDVNKDDTKVEARFKEVSAAYSIVGDAKNRQRFDRGEIDANGNDVAPRFNYQNAGGGGRGNGGRGAGGFSAEDIFGDFSSVFENMRGGGAGGRRQAKGQDRAYKIDVDFLDAARGDKRRITLPSGKSLNVSIPAGIENGKQIRLKGQGEAGQGSMPAGDALIEVTISEHAYFTRDGLDITVELPISLPEAVNGGKVQIPTVNGPVTMSVPKGANTGRRMRLKGKGIKAAGDKKSGDQYVVLKVMLPENIDDDLAKAVAKWAKQNDYNPRLKAGLE
jgi:DnaJ-class molecular chaperone